MHHNAPYLRVLLKGTTKQRRGVIDGASKELISCLCECALNVLNGNVKLKPADKRKLSKYKTQLRALGTRRLSVQKKKKILRQKGGFLGALLTPVLSALGGLLFK
mgnify:CR=1 FL=1